MSSDKRYKTFLDTRRVCHFVRPSRVFQFGEHIFREDITILLVGTATGEYLRVTDNANHCRQPLPARIRALANDDKPKSFLCTYRYVARVSSASINIILNTLRGRWRVTIEKPTESVVDFQRVYFFHQHTREKKNIDSIESSL